jgi:hypothetical protein
MPVSRQIKRFLIRLLFFIPIPVLMIVINLTADPAKLFDNGNYERELARLMASGQNVGNIRNHNDRFTQKFYVECIDEAPQVLVIGSSQSMQISHMLFPGKTFHNSSVPNATLQDYITITELYLQKGLKPDTLVLGLNPFIFNSKNGKERWKDLKTLYLAGYKRVTSRTGKVEMRRSIINDKYLALISPSYLQSSMKAIFRPKAVSEYYPTVETIGDDPIMWADGSYQYGKEMRALTGEDVLQLTQARIEDKSISYAEFDQNLLELFEKFVTYLVDNGIEVIFYIAPYHPVTYKQILESRKYDIVVEFEIYVRTFASGKGIQVVGSYDPDELGLGIDDFHDWVHTRRAAVNKIWHDAGFE